MRLLSEVRERLRAIVFGNREERELEAELRFHIEKQTEENQRRGLNPEEARRQAYLSLGGVERTKERVRDARGVRPLEDLVRDLRHGLRRLLREPGFTLPVVLTLMLGIGATTAMFSVVDAVLLRPLPFEEDERLVTIDEIAVPMRFPGSEGEEKTLPDLTDLDSLDGVFSQSAAYAPGSLNLESGGESRRLAVALVTPSFFSTLGVQPAVGRPFNDAEGTPEHARAAILSNPLWQRHFGADANAIGRTLSLNGNEYRIVGVMPEGFAFPGETEVWLPMPVPMTLDYWEPFRMYMPSRVIARLAPGATAEQARDRVSALAEAYRPPDRPAEAMAAQRVQPLRDVLVRQRRTALLILMGATGLMLLMACANAANLVLARAARRRRELALRTALGASRSRILRQLLIESLLVAVAGSALGVAVAYASAGALHGLVPAALAGVAPPRIDLRVLAFALAAAVGSGIAFGIWPGLRADVAAANAAMKTGHGAGGTARDAARLRSFFVISELALAVVLLVGTGVLLRSFQAVLATDPGLDPAGVATLEMSLARAEYPPAERGPFLDALLGRLHAMPDVQAAAIVNELPLRGEGGVRVTIAAEGAPPAAAMDERIFAQYLTVTPDYFRALGIPLLRGRAAVASADSTAPAEIVISRELAGRLWPGEEALGRRVEWAAGTLRTVVGVVGDVRVGAIDNDEVAPQMYLPFAEQGGLDLAVVARGSADPRLLAARLRDAVRSVDPSQAVYNVRTMEQVIASAITPRRTTTLLVSIFGGLALLLAAVGIYGVISFGVARRRSELGIRVALGARSGHLIRLVLNEGVALAAFGAGLGIVAAWALSRVLESLVYGVGVRDPVAFAAAPVVLLVVAVLATAVPARRATRANPLESIRVE